MRSLTSIATLTPGLVLRPVQLSKFADVWGLPIWGDTKKFNFHNNHLHHSKWGVPVQKTAPKNIYNHCLLASYTKTPHEIVEESSVPQFPSLGCWFWAAYTSSMPFGRTFGRWALFFTLFFFQAASPAVPEPHSFRFRPTSASVPLPVLWFWN